MDTVVTPPVPAPPCEPGLTRPAVSGRSGRRRLQKLPPRRPSGV